MIKKFFLTACNGRFGNAILVHARPEWLSEQSTTKHDMKKKEDNLRDFAAPAQAVGRASASGCAALEVSDLKVPARDPRGEAIKELDDMCADLVKAVHDLNAATDERMIGRLEERVYTMTDAIHRRQRELYLNHNILIAISHTQDGLPIRVNKMRKCNLWG